MYLDQRSSEIVPSGCYSKECNYTLHKILGKGTFGKVFLAVHEPTKEIVAIKRSPKWSNKYPREAQMLECMLDSSFFVSLKGIFYTSTEKGYNMQNLVFDYMPMSIGKYIRSLKEKKDDSAPSRIEPVILRQIILQIVEGLRDLHAKSIAHRDLKPDNILLNPKSHYKVSICDLGSAKIVGSSVTSIPYICSRWYRSPELLCGSMNYSTAIDLWSLGCIIFELITFLPLFPGKSKKKGQSEECSQLINIMEILGSPPKNFYEEIKEKTSDTNVNVLQHFCELNVEPLNLKTILMPVLEEDEYELIDIMQALLKWCPSERSTAADLLKCKYFQQATHKEDPTETKKQTRVITKK